MNELFSVLTADLRRRAMQEDPPFSTAILVDACFPDALITGAVLAEGVDSLSARRSDGTTIVYARGLSCPERRIAIAHGMARLLLDPGSPASEAECGARADLFAAELLAPLDQVRARATRFPSADPEEQELYLDHVDDLSLMFAVTADIIDVQIRRLLLM